MDRALLHDRLHRRVELMHERGLLDEIRALNEQGLQEGKTASRATGYALFARALEDEDYGVEQAIEDTTIATRQFARRQLTWFRGDERVRWLDALSPTLADDAESIIRESTR
jgi:tRNA dimethylallyltransferase